GDGTAVATAASLRWGVDRPDARPVGRPPALAADRDRLTAVLPETETGGRARQAPIDCRLELDMWAVVRQCLRLKRTQPVEDEVAVVGGGATRRAGHAAWLVHASRRVDALSHAHASRPAPRVGERVNLRQRARHARDLDTALAQRLREERQRVVLERF